ncbi:hypothetical protein NONI108955_41080 [Nocardia ninae]
MTDASVFRDGHASRVFPSANFANPEYTIIVLPEISPRIAASISE